MTEPALLVKKMLLTNCLNWFQADFRQRIVSLVESQFPNYTLPREIQSVLENWEHIRQRMDPVSEPVDLVSLFVELPRAETGDASLFKQILLRYRRQVASRTETYREKTFHLGIIQTLDEDLNALDGITGTDWFQKLETLRLPRASDFLPIQYIEQSLAGQNELAPRQFDEKFHTLQAPALFLPDLACFRARCEVRDAPLAVAFLDIDDFKRFNSAHGEPKVDRHLLSRFMQTLEAHLYHHGFGYRQGGDEYLVLLPSLSKPLAIAFLDELRLKLGALQYPEIGGQATVSIGVCTAVPECSLTDRELRDRANQAKEFAKEHGKNCIATFRGEELIPAELEVVRPGLAQKSLK